MRSKIKPMCLRSLVCLVSLLYCSGLFAEDNFILLQSTTSTKNSGLYDYLIPLFTADTGIDVRVVAVGTGQALRNAQNGDADVLIVHAKSREERFIIEGYGLQRHQFMYNDFVIVGPTSDPADVAKSETVKESLQRIVKAGSSFVSRGDDSGTHTKELELWRSAGLTVSDASGGWYKEVGAGMGATLNASVALQAYTLSDRATWLNFGNKKDYRLLFEGDPPLHNQYSVIVVNPARHTHVKLKLAQTFADWLLAARGQRAIAGYHIAGDQLFFPNAKQ